MEHTHTPPSFSPIPTVNFHVWKACDMKCAHCFARFTDAGHSHLSRAEALDVVRALGMGFERITFVGGEPTLCPWLLDLMSEARAMGMSVGLVTNGSRIIRDPEFRQQVLEGLDWLGVSIDSFVPETNAAIGRLTRRGVIESGDMIRLAATARRSGVLFKVNTVVVRANVDEDMTAGLLVLCPDRWKVLHALPVLGQNEHAYESCGVPHEDFTGFVARHRSVESAGVLIVPEDHAAMTGSYAMVDPGGFAFDNVDGKYSYSSKPVHEVGWRSAFEDVRLNVTRFFGRGGDHYKLGGSQ